MAKRPESPVSGHKYPPKKTYIDSNGVERGWYVYEHVDNSTGQVFYVGKGIGKRAWRTSGRNANWEQYVANISGKYSVELIEGDLSEIEAEELECELIRQHVGGKELETGVLTNILAGEKLAVTLSVETIAQEEGVREILEKYETLFQQATVVGDEETVQELGVVDDEVQFIELPRSKAHLIAESLGEKTDSLYDENTDWIFKNMESGHDELEMVASIFHGELTEIRHTCDDFSRRRISWKNFCEDVWMRFGEFGWSTSDLVENPPEFDFDQQPIRGMLDLIAEFSKLIIVKG